MVNEMLQILNNLVTGTKVSVTEIPNEKYIVSDVETGSALVEATYGNFDLVAKVLNSFKMSPTEESIVEFPELAY